MMIIPERCGRCHRKKKGLRLIIIPPIQRIKTSRDGRKITVPYSPSLYICKSCLEDLHVWADFQLKKSRDEVEKE